MRKSSNPFRGIGPRSGLALVLLALLTVAALAAGAATADRPRHERPVKSEKPVPSSTAIASARAIAKRVTAIAKTDARLRVKAQAAAKKKKIVETNLPLVAVADGNVLYASYIKIRATRDLEDLVSLRFVLERTDRTTGATVKLLDKLNTYPLGLYASGGSVGLETLALVPKRTKKGTEIAAKTAIYTATNADTSLRAIDVADLTLDRDEDVCGDFSVLAGLSDLAEPMVAAVDAECDEDGPGTEELVAELELWKSDGSRKPLGPAAVESAFFGSGFSLKGAKLLQPNPYEPSTSLRDLDSGNLASLWTPAARQSELAADGTVALVGTPAENLLEDFYGDYATSESATTETAGSTAAEGEGIPAVPAPPMGDRPVRRFPFVVFPGGNPENPVLVKASRQSVAALKFCGPNLYVLDRTATKGLSRGDDAELGDFFLFQYFSSLKLDVQLYDAQGQFVRSLVKTHPLALAGAGCNGDKLIVISLRRDKFVTTEIGT